MGNTETNSNRQEIAAKTVSYLSNSIPDDSKYKAIDCESIRFCDISAYKSERNEYLFTMTLRNEIDIRECIPVLNEIVHCIGKENYEVSISVNMVVDIFDNRFESTLMQVKNDKTKSEYSMKIIPFKSYNNIKFKKAFYELYLNKQLGYRSNSTVQLLDYYVYGLNPDSQAFVFLFEKCSTSLANVAEYRNEANLHWTDKEKIKVMIEVLESYESLVNKNIIHRDLRPSNIFFVPSSGKFVIGNLSRARLLRRNFESDLMSVCGVPDFSCEEMQLLMREREQIGSYDGIKQDYYGLRSILKLIETCDIYDKNPSFYCKELGFISDMLSNHVDFKKIMEEVRKIEKSKSIDRFAEIGDREIAESCSFLLAHTHKSLIEGYTFEAYGHLGYHKNYSDKAHKMLEKNNENGKEFENATILNNLGDFYEMKGSKGTEYYYNAFVLFIVRADNQVRYGYPDKAEIELSSAQEAFFKFNRVIESELPRIEINRVSSLIDLENGNIKNGIKTINETFIKAAQNNIPVDKQCKILLAYGKIYKVIADTRSEALKKLVTGVSICENSSVFESPSQCRIYKSKFLKEIGSLYVLDLIEKSDPRKKSEAQESNLELRAQAESHLRSALEIQERENVDDLDVAETLENLGKLYYYDHNYYDAKRYYDTTKIRFAHIKEFVNPEKQINVLYMRGSCCYYLKEFTEARLDYQTCLTTLEKLPKSHSNQLFAYNIQGNLGLTLLKLGNPDGRNTIERALLQLKELKGVQSYDYISLYQHYENAINS